MITIDLDNKFAIVSDGEVLNLVQKDGKMRKNGTPSGRKWWFQTYGQAIKFYEKKVDAGKPIHSLRELAKQIDSGYKRIEIMVDQKLKEVGIEWKLECGFSHPTIRPLMKMTLSKSPIIFLMMI